MYFFDDRLIRRCASFLLTVSDRNCLGFLFRNGLRLVRALSFSIASKLGRRPFLENRRESSRVQTVGDRGARTKPDTFKSGSPGLSACQISPPYVTSGISATPSSDVCERHVFRVDLDRARARRILFPAVQRSWGQMSAPPSTLLSTPVGQKRLTSTMSESVGSTVMLNAPGCIDVVPGSHPRPRSAMCRPCGRQNPRFRGGVGRR